MSFSCFGEKNDGNLVIYVLFLNFQMLHHELHVHDEHVLRRDSSYTRNLRYSLSTFLFFTLYEPYLCFLILHGIRTSKKNNLLEKC